MKSQKQLESFTAYCKMYPELRFWQALRNWSQYSFIYGSNHPTTSFVCHESCERKLEDTFYKE